jgi:phosphoglycerate dehydrogenase-like enzyme
MSLPVHLLQLPYTQETIADLRSRLHPDVHLTAGLELPSPAAFRILVAGRPERDHLLASPHLEALVVPWAGIPDATRDLIRQFPHIALHNLHHNALPVAEQAIALLLAACKFVVPMDRALRAGDWTPRYRPNPSLLLQGRTALVLGYGAIGRQVARLCRGLGMEVVAVRRRATAGEAPEVDEADGVRLAGISQLHDLLPRATAVLVCLPFTPETEGLVGAAELALLPPQAVLVNVGRGPIVDEAALYHALRDGRLYAAGLDVWYNYPPDEAGRSHTPPSRYPFYELDNVVMSPHRAGGSTETERLRVIHLAEMLNAAARGDPLPNRVDVQAGY